MYLYKYIFNDPTGVDIYNRRDMTVFFYYLFRQTFLTVKRLGVKTRFMFHTYNVVGFGLKRTDDKILEAYRVVNGCSNK